jgi:hypothetical protein
MDFTPVIVVAVFVVFLGTAIFQWLWNITMPQVFNLREISFWIAFRLLLIAGFLSSGSFIKFNSNR